MVKVVPGKEVNPLNVSLTPDEGPSGPAPSGLTAGDLFSALQSPALRAIYAADQVSTLALTCPRGQREPLEIIAALTQQDPASLAALVPQLVDAFHSTGLERVRAGILTLVSKVVTPGEAGILHAMAVDGLQHGYSALQKAALGALRDHPAAAFVQSLLDYVRMQKNPQLRDAGNRAVEAALAAC